MSYNNSCKILLFSENIDLLSDLFFYAKTQKLDVTACNHAAELLLRAHRFGPDVLLIDEDTYLLCRVFADIAKTLKDSTGMRVLLLTKNPDKISFDNKVIDEVHFMSREIIGSLFGKV